MAAGAPILAQQHIERHLDLPNDFFNPPADYLLEVHGDSMINVGILDGDLIAVHKTAQARNGQIIVARVGEEVTVKRFQKDNNIVQLIAENPDYSPIILDLANDPLDIEGLYVGVIRQH